MSFSAFMNFLTESSKQFYDKVLSHMPVEETSIKTTRKEVGSLIQHIFWESKSVWQAIVKCGPWLSRTYVVPRKIRSYTDNSKRAFYRHSYCLVYNVTLITFRKVIHTHQDIPVIITELHDFTVQEILIVKDSVFTNFSTC